MSFENTGYPGLSSSLCAPISPRHAGEHKGREEGGHFHQALAQQVSPWRCRPEGDKAARPKAASGTMAAALAQEGLEKDLIKAEKKQKATLAETELALAELSSLLRAALARASSGASSASDELRSVAAEVEQRRYHTRVKDASHQAYHAVSKLGKRVDDLAHPDVIAASRGAGSGGLAGGSNARDIDRVVADHLFREGRDDIGRTFCREAGLGDPDAIAAPYADLRRIVDPLRAPGPRGRRDVGPALAWIEARRDELGPDDADDLDFRLRRRAGGRSRKRHGSSADPCARVAPPRPPPSQVALS